MNFDFTPPELQFSDFALLALLLALLHGMTLFDGAGMSARSGTKAADRSAAATWTYAGIALTLVAGLVAHSVTRTDAALFLFPFFFVSRWFFHYGRASSLLDFSYVTWEVKRLRVDAIRNSLPCREEEARTLDEIYALASRNVDMFVLVNAGLRLGKRFIPVPAQETLARYLLLSVEDVKATLQDWTSRRLIAVRPTDDVPCYYSLREFSIEEGM